MRRKRLLLLLGVLLAVGLAVQGTAASSEGARVLDFDTMTPVVAPFTGTANPIRGLGGGGVPWALAAAKGELRTDGRLEVEVQGLVIASTGVNPVTQFKAIVSCLSSAGASVATNNVSTDLFDASPAGDAKIEAQIDLPSQCVAPIVFVTNAAGRWFAVTGSG